MWQEPYRHDDKHAKMKFDCSFYVKRRTPVNANQEMAFYLMRFSLCE